MEATATDSATSSEIDPNRCCCQDGTPNCLVPAEHIVALDKVESTKAQPIDLGERYEVLEVIGYGGMGTVHRARDKVLGKEFAIKVLKDELAADESAIKRFEQEASAASDLTHANMLAVYGHGKTSAGSHYIVMDLLEGESLAQLLKREGSLDANRMINISIQICHALAHAHMKGLVHRDLKPSNIMLVKSGSSVELVKVLDFGIAKLMPGQKRETLNLTQTGEIFGSPAYMSPEQCLGCSQDARSDIYSLGCMMYEMIAGRPPLAGKNPIQTVAKHLNEEPQDLGKVAPHKFPRGLEATIMRCLEKDAEQRYQSMDHLAVDLQKIVAGQEPVHKRKKKKEPIDLLSVPMLAGYAAVTSLAQMSGQSLLTCLVPIFWCVILCTYFYRWLRKMRKSLFSTQEKWKTSVICALFCLFFLYIPDQILSVVNDHWHWQLQHYSEIRHSLNAAQFVVAELLIPICSLGWIISWALEKTGWPRHVIRRICLLASLVLPILLFLGRPQVASASLKLARELDPGFGYQSKIRTSSWLDLPARSLIDLALLIDPKSMEAHHFKASTRTPAEQKDALSEYSRVIQNNAKDSFWRDSLNGRANIHFENRHYDLALNDLNLLIDAILANQNPDSALAVQDYQMSEYYFRRARCYEKMDQYENALANYSQAIGFGAHAYADRARVNEKLGKYAAALSDYSTAIETHPYSHKYYMARAGVYKKLGDLSKAAEDYFSAISNHEIVNGFDDKNNKGENQYYAAKAYEALGDKTRALVQFDLAKKTGFSGENADQLTIDGSW